MTMTLIETKTLGTAAATIEFTSIPQDYTDLVIFISGRSSAALVFTEIGVYFNGATFPVSGSSNRYLEGDGSAASSITTSNYTHAGRISAASSTSNTFGSVQVYVPNYTGATAKSVSTDSVAENNATASRQAIAASIVTSTAAITSALFNLSSGNFEAGTTISFYGILKGTSGGVTTS